MAKQYGYMDSTDMPNIAAAIREKNASAPSNLKISEMPDAIRGIDTKPTPSTPVNETIEPGDSITVSEGYYEVAGSVSASLATSGEHIDSSLKSGSQTTTIVPGASTTVVGNKFYTADSVISASLASSESEIDSSLKTTGVTETIAPGSSKTIDGGKYYTSDSKVTADLAKTSTQIDSTLKSTGYSQTIKPGENATINGGKFYTSDSTISASLATQDAEIDDSIKMDSQSSSIVPGGSKTISGGKFYTADSVISASLASSESEIDSTLKSTGANETITPGGSTTINGGKYYTSDSTISASLATQSSEIDNSIKKSAETFNPSTTIQKVLAGQYLTGDQIITPITSENIPNDLLETRGITAPLTGNTVVNANQGKVMTSVTVNAPDMSDATATEDDIKIGKKAYVGGTLITGTHEEPQTSADTSDATATADDILQGKTAYINSGKVTGTLEFITCYTGETDPSSSEGKDGDIYILVTESSVSTAGSISSSTNSISLSDDLASDTYTLKYEDSTGNPISEWAEIGTVEK